MKKYKTIILGFENCESLSFTSDEIEQFFIGKIYTSIHTLSDNMVDEFRSSKYFSIKIKSSGNQNYYPFEQNESVSVLKFERLNMSKNIVSVRVVYEDDTETDVYVPWDSVNEYVNEQQVNTLNDDGSLSIEIK
ncbi:hypothetical protein H6F38_23220 [Paenibacillus sp. EKM208P]|nr:hypothetical protein H6F38_23220 [Paenibacillus sp. EKM208P]